MPEAETVVLQKREVSKVVNDVPTAMQMLLMVMQLSTDAVTAATVMRGIGRFYTPYTHPPILKLSPESLALSL